MVGLVTKAMNDIVLNRTHTQTSNDIEQLALEALTIGLGIVLKPYLLQPLKTPNATTGPIQWMMVLGRKNTKPLSSLGFSLGDHGDALFGLDANCQIDVEADWQLNVTVGFEASTALKLTFPDAPLPILKAKASVHVDKTKGCNVRFFESESETVVVVWFCGCAVVWLCSFVVVWLCSFVVVSCYSHL